MGHIDEEMVPDFTTAEGLQSVTGSPPSRDPQQEAYQLLLVAASTTKQTMPFMFEKIAGLYRTADT